MNEQTVEITYQDQFHKEHTMVVPLLPIPIEFYRCLDELSYFLYNHEPDGSVSPLPVLPIGLGRNIGKRQPPLRFGRPKREFSKEWVQSPVDSVRQRNRGANNP